MLGKVLRKSTCAQCRFCCSFRRCSLWETPLFDMNVVDKYEKKLSGTETPDNGEAASDNGESASGGGCHGGVAFEHRCINGALCGQMNLEYRYQTDDAEEEAPCEFLDVHTGCVLSDEDKPFDCKIWPLRIMKKGSETVIALTPTCPAINSVGVSAMKALVEDGLGNVIFKYASKNPFIIKDYRDGFPVLMTFDGIS